MEPVNHCPHCGAAVDVNASVCPECGLPVDTVYSRIVGFYVPVKTYSKERREEYKMRLWEDVNR